MSFRLGEFECSQCGYSQPVEQPTEEHTVSGPGFRKEQWQREQPPAGLTQAPPPPSERAYGGFTPSATVRGRANFSPTGNTEKMILLGVFLVKAIVNVMVATTVDDPDLPGTYIVGAQILGELFNLGIIIAVFYIPWIWSKWCCATYTCAVGALSLGSLLLSAFFLPFVAMLVPTGGLTVFAAWLVRILNAGVYLWVASVLFRDIHQIQAE